MDNSIEVITITNSLSTANLPAGDDDSDNYYAGLTDLKTEDSAPASTSPDKIKRASSSLLSVTTVLKGILTT